MTREARSAHVAATMISPTHQGKILDSVSWSFFVIALIVCYMRLHADFKTLKKPRLDTYIAFLTFVSASESFPTHVSLKGFSNIQSQLVATASQVFTTLSVHYGMGQHLKSLESMQIVYSLKWGWMAQISQLFANVTGKLAVITYLNVFPGPSQAQARRACLWTLGSLQIATFIVLLAFILTQCSPLQKL